MRTLKVSFACGLGSGIGTFVALGVSHYFWWIGLLVGGLVGYLSYEFRTVIAAIGKAWRRVIGWWPDKELSIISLRFGWSVFLSLTTYIIGMLLVSLIISQLLISSFGPAESIKSLLVGYGLSYGVIGVLCFLIAFFVGTTKECPAEIEKWIQKEKPFNPVSVYFYFLPKGIWWCLERVPVAIRRILSLLVLTIRFIRTVFLTIHSDIRLLCGVDALIGTAVGYFTGNVLVGAIAGGVIGIANYELLSIRVLNLVPERSA